MFFSRRPVERPEHDALPHNSNARDAHPHITSPHNTHSHDAHSHNANAHDAHPHDAPSSSFNRRSQSRMSVVELQQRRDQLPWYWRVVASIASSLILLGFLVFANSFPTLTKNAARAQALSIAAVILLAAGYACSVLVWLSCSSWLFQLDFLFLPCFLSCLLGLLNTVISLAAIPPTSAEWDASIVAALALSVASAIVYGALAALVYRRIQHVRARQLQRGLRGSESAKLLPEDEQQRQQLLRLLMTKDSDRNRTSPAASTFHIDIPDNVRAQHRSPHSPPLPPLPQAELSLYSQHHNLHPSPNSPAFPLVRPSHDPFPFGRPSTDPSHAPAGTFLAAPSSVYETDRSRSVTPSAFSHAPGEEPFRLLHENDSLLQTIDRRQQALEAARERSRLREQLVNTPTHDKDYDVEASPRPPTDQLSRSNSNGVPVIVNSRNFDLHEDPGRLPLSERHPLERREHISATPVSPAPVPSPAQTASSHSEEYASATGPVASPRTTPNQAAHLSTLTPAAHARSSSWDKVEREQHRGGVYRPSDHETVASTDRSQRHSANGLITAADRMQRYSQIGLANGLESVAAQPRPGSALDTGNARRISQTGPASSSENPKRFSPMSLAPGIELNKNRHSQSGAIALQDQRYSQDVSASRAPMRVNRYSDLGPVHVSSYGHRHSQSGPVGGPGPALAPSAPSHGQDQEVPRSLSPYQHPESRDRDQDRHRLSSSARLTSLTPEAHHEIDLGSVPRPRSTRNSQIKLSSSPSPVLSLGAARPRSRADVDVELDGFGLAETGMGPSSLSQTDQTVELEADDAAVRHARRVHRREQSVREAAGDRQRRERWGF